MSENTAAIIGYVLFAISEIIPLLPIPANGVFHSFIIGLQNSFKNPHVDLELGQQLSGLQTQSKSINLHDVIEYINTNPDKLPHVKTYINGIEQAK